MPNITVYTTSQCPYCVMVKNFLNDEGLTFKEVNVQRNQREAQRLVKETGHIGVPQINIDGQWVLGFDPESIMKLVQKEG
ncbi:glutaredoxin 3 [Bacillus carboniphilus]|uniref:Glutaredoxin 3 n=1 Tax=Bacillus carboniphilus TaxID=86663 RepID=A0ABN0VSD1_9BACI